MTKRSSRGRTSASWSSKSSCSSRGEWQDRAPSPAKTCPRVTRRDHMKNFHPVEELARDERFVRTPLFDPTDKRRATDVDNDVRSRLHPLDEAAPEGARSLMHGIFMGEIQALEGAGRTAWDFRDDGETPCQLLLDMA